MRKSVRIALPLLIIALLAVMAGAPSAAAQAGGGPSVTMSLVSPAAQVRIDSPLPVKAAFSEPVSGFTLDDISVVNGAAGNFTGSDGDSVYTFDVTPNSIGTVMVDIAAGAAQDPGGDGNTAAPLLSLGIPYDDDGDGEISKSEVIASIRDYFADRVAKVHVIGITRLYFAGPPPGPSPAATPGAPTGLSATANGQTQIDLSRSGPSDDGGAAVTGYRIEVSADRMAWSDLVGDSGSTSTTHFHTGLTAGSTRHYRVSAINSAGAGSASAIATGATASAPPAGSPATDRAALVTLYNATGGADWTDNTNWLSDGPLDDWYGVTTDTNGRVTELNLGDNDLAGEMPTELGNLSNLEHLYLYNNQLTGEIPAELGSLSNLNSLWLHDNQLTGGIPAELGDLTNLVRLRLYSNQLSGEIPSELGSLANLQGLHLFSNRLSGAIPTELGSLSKLQVLYLWGNQLTGPIPASLGGLANLEELHLDINQLTGTIPAELGSLTNLRFLSLPHNQLTGEIPSELGSLTNLEWLYLFSNHLTGEIPAELGSLTNLVRLWLTNNQLTGEIPAELGSLTNLVRLWLNNNQLTGGIPAELGSLTNLEWLLLTNNQLTEEIPAELGSLTNLEWLLLSGNQLTGEIPGELGGLTNLQILWLSGNQLTGCIPNGLRGIETNDLSELGLPFCDMPGAPTIATPIVPGDASLTVAWAAPINTGSSAITAYDLRYIETGAADKSDANWTVMEDVWAAGSGSLQYTLSGLTGGTQYDVQVRAVNAAGASAWSAAVTGTTASAGTAGDPLFVRYDTNGNGMIEKNEVIAAINDYLFGEGDEAISKSDVIELINLYLFG